MQSQIGSKEGIPPNAIPAVESYLADPLQPGVDGCPGCVTLKGGIYCQLLGGRKDGPETGYVAVTVARQVNNAFKDPTKLDTNTDSYHPDKPPLSCAETAAIGLTAVIEKARNDAQEGGASGLFLHYDHDYPVGRLTVCAQHEKSVRAVKLLNYIANNSTEQSVEASRQAGQATSQ